MDVFSRLKDHQPTNVHEPPEIPFSEIGLKLDAHRSVMPEKSFYRRAIREFYRGVPSMPPGTTKRINTAKDLS